MYAMAGKDKEKWRVARNLCHVKVDKGLTNANYQPEKTHTEILVSKNCHKVRKGIFKKWLLKKLISLCEDT